MNIYKIDSARLLLLYLRSLAMIACFLWLLFLISTEKDVVLICGAATLGVFILLTVGSLFNLTKWKMIIGDDCIHLKDAFSEKKLMFSEIKGYRITTTDILLESNIAKIRTLKITNLVGHKKIFIEWLSSQLLYPTLFVVYLTNKKES